MVIDGKVIADAILTKLTQSITMLTQRGITPTLAVILVGNDVGSLSYIKQKQKAAERIGVRTLLELLPGTISPITLESTIAHYNNDPKTHGVIVQRPVPLPINAVGDILMTVTPSKDVDGFLPNSPFEVPVARAVITILKDIHTQLSNQQFISTDFIPWLKQQHIAIMGKGETAGKPIATLFQNYNCATSIIDSRTPHPHVITKQASIIISCVGKERAVTKHMLSTGVILISVGLTRGTDGKLHGDYEPEDVKDSAIYYTPTPGGVGPVNVASLMQNVVDAALITLDAK